MGYFEESQHIKEEILGSPELMSILRKHLFLEQRAVLIDKGRNNAHYRIGHLQSGFWVATRESLLTKQRDEDLPDGGFRIWFGPRTLYDDIERLEEFCQRAEAEYNLGRYIVTSFCVGASYTLDGEEIGLILLEDLTKGGAVNICITSGSDEGVIEGEKRRVNFDLSNDNRAIGSKKYHSVQIDAIRYFDPVNRIVIR